MSRFRTLLMAGFAMLGVACGSDITEETLASSRAPQANPHLINVHMKNCNLMVGAFQVDPVAARKIVPAKYELMLQPNGAALIYTSFAQCDITDNITGADLPTIEFADWWMMIKNPANPNEGGSDPWVYEPIPGAYWTMPNQYAYVFKADTVADWLKTETAAVHFYKEKVQSVSVIDQTPFSSGKVVEQNGAEYSWQDVLPCNMGILKDYGVPDGGCWMLPGVFQFPVAVGLPPFMMGFNLRGFQDQIGGGGQKELHCLQAYTGQGIMAFTAGGKSLLATSGLFPADTPVYAYYDYSYSDCQLIMKEQ